MLLLLQPAAAAHSIRTEAEIDAWESIVAVVLGCFYHCPLDCDAPVMAVDCAAVEDACWKNK